MKKWIGILAAAAVTVCSVVSGRFGSMDVQAAGRTYNAEQTQALAGTVWNAEDEVEFTDCAVQLRFYYNADGTEEENNALRAQVEEYAEGKGYNVFDPAADANVYLIFDDLSALFIGENLEYMEDGMRSCHNAVIWMEQEGSDGWGVSEVTDRGIYTFEGEEYPCYTVHLVPYYIPAATEQKVSVPGCSHEIDHIITKEPTVDEDGIVSVKCTKCSHTEYTYKISGHGAFLLASAKKINEAAPGETVKIKTDRWMSFNKTVLDAIEANPEVTVVVEYWYSNGKKGEMCTLAIPAGSQVSQFANEEGFCGFEYLAYQLAVAAMAK